MIALGSFLHSVSRKEFFEKNRVVTVFLPAQAASFFPLLVSCLQKSVLQKVRLIDVETVTFAELQAELEMSFLGNFSLYIVYAGAQATGKLDPRLFSYLTAYQGDHMIVVVTKIEKKPAGDGRVAVVKVDEFIDRETYSHLYSVVHSETPDPRFTEKLFRFSSTIPLDVACLMAPYHAVIGKNIDQFFAHWYTRIVPEQHSLFILSQYLFARDGKRFYHEWSEVRDEYPLEFWTAFWSEQLWQAILFTTTAKNSGVPAAKKVITRLPFSFAQKDWQKHSVDRLVQTFEFLYQIDFMSKNGGEGNGLDLLYAKMLFDH